MRKKIATWLLAFALILPCSMLLTACEKKKEAGDAKVESISVELVSSDYTMKNNTIEIPYGGKVEFTATDFKMTATMDNGEKKTVPAKTDTEDGYTFSSTIPSDEITPIGDYSITFSHEEVEENLVICVKVVKADVDMSAVTWNYTSPFNYDKTAKSVMLTNLPEGVTVTYETRIVENGLKGDVVVNPTIVGNYITTATFTYSDTENYNPIPDKELNWEIIPGVFQEVGTVKLKQEYNFTYDGQEHTVELDLSGLDTTNVEVDSITGLTSNMGGNHTAYVYLSYIGSDANYDRAKTVAVSWEIKRVTLTVTANDNTITYGDVATDNGATISGFVNGEDESVLSGTLAFTYGNYEVGSSVGTYSIMPKGFNLGNYKFNYVAGTLTVEKKSLTVKVNDVTISYNTDAHDNGVTATGLVAGDTIDSIGNSISFDFGGYAKGQPIGSYDITVSGLDDTNYDITYQKGILTVEKADVPVDVNQIALENNLFEYDGEEHSVTVDPSTVPAGVTVVSVETSGGAKTELGSFVAVIKLQYFDTANYNPMADITRTWTITKANVGSFDGVGVNQNSFVYTGLQHAVEVTGVPAGARINTISGTTATAVGTYTVNVTFVCSDEAHYNTFETVTKTITWKVTPATLTVTANPYTVKYGETLSNNGYQVAGFVNGETDAVIQGEVKYSYTYAMGGDIGTYAITPYGLGADNYTFNYVSGEMTVERNQFDFTNVDWVKASSYTYTGKAIKPVLNINSPYININYSYLQDGITAEPIAIGTYVAKAQFDLNTKNYDIINSNVTDYEYEIVTAKVNVANLTWNIGEEIEYSGKKVLPVISNLPSSLNVKYSYTTISDEEEIEPIDVGEYVVHVYLSTINSNYEIVGDFSDLTFKIVTKKIDCSALAWVGEHEYAFDGNQHFPTTNMAGTDGIWSYSNYIYENQDNQPNGFTSGVTAGKYVASVRLEVTNSNYELINYTPLADFEFEIKQMRIDISDLDWKDVPENEKYIYSGSAIKPVLNKTSLGSGHLTFNYYYYNQYTMADEESPEENSVTPIEVGRYYAIAFFNFKYPSMNYILMRDGYKYNGSYNGSYDEFYYRIGLPEATVDTSKIKWTVGDGSVEVTPSEYDDKCWNARTEYSGTAIPVSVTVGDMFDVEFTDGIPPIEVDSTHTVNIRVKVKLKESYSSKYEMETQEYTLFLYTIFNPFSSIKLDGVEIPFLTFDDKYIFLPNTELSFTLRDGFTAYDSTEEDAQPLNISTFTIKDYYSENPTKLYIKNSYGRTIYKKELFYFDSIDEFEVDNQRVLHSGAEVTVPVGKTSFDISFDKKFLTQYGSNLVYEIIYRNNTAEPESKTVTSLPITITQANMVSEVHLILKKGENEYDYDYEYLLHVFVEQTTKILDIKYTTIALDEDTPIKQYSTTNSTIHLYDEIMIDFEAVVMEGYTVKYYNSFTREEEIFNKVIPSGSFYVVVYDGDEEVERKLVEIKSIMYTTHNGVIRQLNGFSNYITDKNTFSLNIANANSRVTVSSLVDGRESITLTQDVTPVTHTVTVVYNSKTYTYSRDVFILRSLTVNECINANPSSTTTYITNTKTGDRYILDAGDNRLNIYDYYDASTFKNFNVANIVIPLIDGVEIEKKEIITCDGKCFLKITFKEDGTYITSDSLDYLIAELYFNGEFDSDTSATIQIETTNTSEDITNTVTDTINLNIASEMLTVELNNSFAVAEFKNSDGNVLFTSSMGNLNISSYIIDVVGTYTLVITATDGTTKTYTVKLTRSETSDPSVDPDNPETPAITVPNFTITINGETVGTDDSGVANGSTVVVYLTQSRADLISAGIISNNVLTIESFTCESGYYLYGYSARDTEGYDLYKLVNGGYLSTNLFNWDDFGIGASILVFDSEGDFTEGSPNYCEIAIFFSDSVPQGTEDEGSGTDFYMYLTDEA